MKYTENHLWVKQKGNSVEIGLTEFGQAQIGDIVFVNLPEEGEAIEKGEAAFSIESSETEFEGEIPFSGEIISVNFDLDDNPEILNDEPSKTYIVRIKPDDPDDIEDLLDKDEYKSICDEY